MDIESGPYIGEVASGQGEGGLWVAWQACWPGREAGIGLDQG